MPIKGIKTLTMKISWGLNIPKETRNKLISQIPIISTFTAKSHLGTINMDFYQVFLPTVFTSQNSNSTHTGISQPDSSERLNSGTWLSPASPSIYQFASVTCVCLFHQPALLLHHDLSRFLQTSVF